MQVNPVIEKELKTKMRGWRAPALITVYLGFLGLIMFLYFLSSDMLSKYSMNYFNPSVALNAYNTLAIIQFGLLLMVTPALTGGAISGERERQTLDLLLCTNLSTFSIVRGKIFVSIAHIMLLITASLPIMGMVFLFGGIRITDLLFLFAFYLATAVMVSSIGIFYSTIFKKSSVSMIVTYITLGFLIVGTIILFGIYMVLFYRNGQGGQPTANELMAFLFANPMFGFGSALDGTGAGMSIFDVFFRIGTYGTPTSFSKVVQPWMANIAFDLVASVVFIILSAWRLKPVKGRVKRGS